MNKKYLWMTFVLGAVMYMAGAVVAVTTNSVPAVIVQLAGSTLIILAMFWTMNYES